MARNSSELEADGIEGRPGPVVSGRGIEGGVPRRSDRNAEGSIAAGDCLIGHFRTCVGMVVMALIIETTDDQAP